MFCPSCRSEFRIGISYCQNCEVDLIAELPQESIFQSTESMAEALKDKDLKPVLVASHVELIKVQDLLAAQQIPSILANEDAANYQPGVASRFFMMVAEEDVDKTIAFLNKSALEGFQREGIVQELTLEDSLKCPACNADAPPNAEECPECGLFLGFGEE